MLDFDSYKLQFGGRLETQRYKPAFGLRGPAGEEDDHAGEDDHDEMEHGDDHEDEIAEAVERTFTGASASVGIHAETWHGGAFVANYVFNLGDRLYRNHSSFIKDLAPEIGRGVRVTYIMRFF